MEIVYVKELDKGIVIKKGNIILIGIKNADLTGIEKKEPA